MLVDERTWKRVQLLPAPLAQLPQDLRCRFRREPYIRFPAETAAEVLRKLCEGSGKKLDTFPRSLVDEHVPQWRSVVRVCAVFLTSSTSNMVRKRSEPVERLMEKALR